MTQQFTTIDAQNAINAAAADALRAYMTACDVPFSAFMRAFLAPTAAQQQESDLRARAAAHRRAAYPPELTRMIAVGERLRVMLRQEGWTEQQRELLDCHYRTVMHYCLDALREFRATYTPPEWAREVGRAA